LGLVALEVRDDVAPGVGGTERIDVREQQPRCTGVLGRDQVGFPEHARRPQRQVLEVADRRADDEQDADHGPLISTPGRPPAPRPAAGHCPGQTAGHRTCFCLLSIYYAWHDSCLDPRNPPPRMERGMKTTEVTDDTSGALVELRGEL